MGKNFLKTNEETPRVLLAFIHVQVKFVKWKSGRGKSVVSYNMVLSSAYMYSYVPALYSQKLTDKKASKFMWLIAIDTYFVHMIHSSLTYSHIPYIFNFQIALQPFLAEEGETFHYGWTMEGKEVKKEFPVNLSFTFLIDLFSCRLSGPTVKLRVHGQKEIEEE